MTSYFFVKCVKWRMPMAGTLMRCQGNLICILHRQKNWRIPSVVLCNVQNDGCHWVARSWSVNSKTALDSITEENDLGNLWLEVEVAVSALQDGQDPQDALSLQAISRKRALWLIASLRKITSELRHHLGLHHQYVYYIHAQYPRLQTCIMITGNGSRR